MEMETLTQQGGFPSSLTLGNILEALVGSHDCGGVKGSLDHKRCLRPRKRGENGRWGCVVRRNDFQRSLRKPWKSLLNMRIERNTRPDALWREESGDLGILGTLLILDEGWCWVVVKNFLRELRLPGLGSQRFFCLPVS